MIISESRKNGSRHLDSLCEFEITRNCFGNVDIPMDNVSHQLLRFCESNLAFACVIYLRRLAYGLSKIGFLERKFRLVSTSKSA